MGMYTELVLAVELKRNTPEEVLSILDYMLSIDRTSEDIPVNLPTHPLFNTERWYHMLTYGSFYFPGKSYSFLYKNYDEKGGMDFVNLTIRCNFKNYDNELKLFLDWIGTYIKEDCISRYIGYSRYEEAEEPTHIYSDAIGLTL